MQPVNNNMDDLFRRAADEYPLKPVGADWNKVSELLQAEKRISKGNNKKRYLWLLLLVLPLSFLFHNVNRKGEYLAESHPVYNPYTGSNDEHMAIRNENKLFKEGPADQQNPVAGVVSGSLGLQRMPQTAPSPGDEPSSVIGTNRTSESSHTENSHKDLTTASKTVKSKPVFAKPAAKPNTGNKIALNSTSATGKGKPAHSFSGKGKSIAEENTGLLTNRKEGNRVSRENISTENKGNKKEAGVLSKSSGKKTGTGGTGNLSKSDPVQPSFEEKTSFKERIAFSGAIATDFGKNKKKTLLDDQLADSMEKAAIPEPAADPIRIRQKKFYAGVLAGPDLSMVKDGKIQGAGYSFGLLAGFKFNKRWSVEAGMLWDEKKYYSDGQYFSTSKMMLPAHTKIIDGHGTCNMIEIPLSVRYTFATPTRHSSWFASAGASSYLMKKEDYHYLYQRYGTSYYATKVYKNSSENWFSIINVSAGYQKKLKHIGDLRIEPYFKIPLRGVGIGSLPISSGGVYFVITRPVR